MWLSAIGHIISPRVCRICGATLTANEQEMCLACDLAMPRTNVHRQSFNIIHQRLGHHSKVDRAAGWFYYHSKTPYAKMLVDSKYSNQPRIDYNLAKKYAEELIRDDFFDGIDLSVPMPMYWWKKFLRGYNQAEEICRGIESATGIPWDTPLKASRSHGVQSRHSRLQRYSKIANTMTLADPEAIDGKHILLVDDIITSGASLMEAIRALLQGTPAAISVLTLGLTQTKS